MTLQDKVEERDMAFGLNSKNQETGRQAAEAKPVDEQAAAGGEEFLNQFAGEGLEGITGNAVAIPWISIMQDRTQHVIDGVCEAGVWRNSATGTVYGKVLRVIPVAFKVIWNERDEDTGKTVTNYEPGSIKPRLVKPKDGRGFPKMENQETGNKIDETFMYAVVLPEAPTEGFALLQASMGSIATYRRWNAQLRAQVLPNGAKAPLFAYQWELIIGDQQSRNAKNQLFWKMVDVARGPLVSKQLFLEGIQPNRQLALSAQLALTAPPDYEVVEEKIEE